jgi:UDP-glucose 4-epimerase
MLTNPINIFKVMDLAEGHVAALKYIQPLAVKDSADSSGYGEYSFFNLGKQMTQIIFNSQLKLNQ